MSLVLTRPLVIFDIEATGVDPLRDRIVEICAVTLLPSGEERVQTWRLNPETPIPPGATAVHGISDADVAGAPTFKMLAPIFCELFREVDLGGYNARRFDVPMLECEFLRAGVSPAPFEGAHIVDVQEIFYLREPRTLTAAVKFYCNEIHAGAHGAESDALATAKVLRAQLTHYGDLPRELPALVELTKPKDRYVDPTRKLVLDDAGDVLLNFGQHRGAKLSDLAKTKKDYLEWMLAGTWHPKVIEAVKAALSCTSPPEASPKPPREVLQLESG